MYKLIQKFNNSKEKNFMKKRSLLGMQSEVNHIASLLNIQSPKLLLVDYLQENKKENPVVRKSSDKLTSGIIHGAFLKSKNTMLLSRVLPVFDPHSHTFKIEEATYADQLYYVAYCLRKEWQREHKSTFENETSADIDADAFALAYAFTSPYLNTPADFTTALPLFALKDSLLFPFESDELKTNKYESRWEKAKKICNEYSFTTTIPLDDAKDFISKDNEIFYKSLMMLCGMPL